MCRYLSFLVSKQGKFYFGDLDSHFGIEAGHDLKPGEYREAEWIDNDPKSLSVRVEEGEDENFYKALILGFYKTRKSLLKGKIVGKTDLAKYIYKDGEFHSFNDKPAVVYSDGDKFWYKNGKLHRDNDKPALISRDGSKYWLKNGKSNRDGDKPIIIYSNGMVRYKNRKFKKV